MANSEQAGDGGAGLHPALHDPNTWTPAIRERYGLRTQRPQRKLALGIVGVACAGLVAATSWRLANPEIAVGVLSYQALSEDHMVLDYEVSRRQETSLVCVLRARSSDGFDVGYAVVELPSGFGRTQHTYDLRTSSRAVIGEVLGCGPGAVPSGVAGAQFRPGDLPPRQPWSPPNG